MTASANDYSKLVEQEHLSLAASELIEDILAATGISRAELARRMGRSRAFVTQTLGGKNITLRTFSDLAFACGYRVSLRCEPLLANLAVEPANVRELDEFRHSRRQQRFEATSSLAAASQAASDAAAAQPIGK